MMLPSSPEDGEKDAPVPMLHMWVDPMMSLQAVCESMHSFVATPPGQHWQLSRTQVGLAACSASSPHLLLPTQSNPVLTCLQGGDLIGGTETPRGPPATGGCNALRVI